MKSIRELMSLEGRVALITGGAGHIGSAMAEALAEAGAKVVLNDMAQDRCDAKAEEIGRKYPGRAAGFAADIGDEKACRGMIHEVAGRFGGLDILIHSAALVGTSKLTGWAVPFLKQETPAWEQALRINLTSAFFLSQEAAPILEKNGHGSIVFVGSTYGIVGPDMRLYDGTAMGNPSAYGASKGGLIQFMRYLSTALAPKVRVNAITPGGVERGQPQQFQERYVFRTPLGRMACEEDYKGAALYLASDLSQYVTGHNLVVDGGWTAW